MPALESAAFSDSHENGASPEATLQVLGPILRGRETILASRGSITSGSVIPSLNSFVQEEGMKGSDRKSQSQPQRVNPSSTQLGFRISTRYSPLNCRENANVGFGVTER